MDYEERKSLRERSAALNISLPLTLLDVIDRFAESREIRVQEAVTLLLRQGLRLEAEQAKAKQR